MEQQPTTKRQVRWLRGSFSSLFRLDKNKNERKKIDSMLPF
jgi:hypothetical protein